MSWCLLQNNPEARKRAGQSQTLERGQAHSDVNWELNSQRLPGSYWPGFQTRASDASEPLPPFPPQLTLGDHGPAQAEHGITKSKCTREGEPRKRQLRESKPPNTYSQTCTSQQEPQRESHKPHSFSKTSLAESTANFTVSAAVRSRQVTLSSKEWAGLLTSILCGQQSRSRKNYTEERQWGRQSPFYGQKYWKRILLEWSMTTGKWLKNAHGAWGDSQRSGRPFGDRDLWKLGSKEKKQAGEVQDLAKQNYIRGHIMLGPTTSHSKKRPPSEKTVLGTGEKAAPGPGLKH